MHGTRPVARRHHAYEYVTARLIIPAMLISRMYGSLCLYDRLSVCHKSEFYETGSRKQRHTIAKRLNFPCPEKGATIFLHPTLPITD